MSRALLDKLRSWRAEQARIEGVETYRVLNNVTLETLVGRMPTTADELLEVKGIKEAKSRKYGKTLLSILASGRADSNHETENERGEAASNEPLTVGQFLDGINTELSGLAARIRGEVTSVDVRDRVIYFTLKDPVDEGMVSCVIFRYQYQVSGVELAIGDEVIVEGVPEIYKPSGRFSLKVGVIELAGEGSLKKAYDALKAKLETEGIFSSERKRSLPPLVERVALITSSEGAAIGDFTMNVGKHGMHVDFYPTAVEGKKAVFEIIEALKYFRQNKKHYDCLVLIRGGGSLESLQAFNNEALVREVSVSPVPVLCGVGHEKDITLVALAADAMVSTPTAAARTLAEPWEEARVRVDHQATLFIQYSDQLCSESEQIIGRSAEHLGQALRDIMASVRVWEERFNEKIQTFPYMIKAYSVELSEIRVTLLERLALMLGQSREQLGHIELSLRQYNPERLLALGYSLVRSGGSVVRSAAKLKRGDRLDIQLGDGRIESEVIKKL